jgi:prevent-host-death family protein
MQDRRSPKPLVFLNKFKAQAADCLNAIAADHAPLFVTQNGPPAAVVLSPRAYGSPTEQARFVAAVNEGNADAEAGRVVDSDSLRTRLRERYGG